MRGREEYERHVVSEVMIEREGGVREAGSE